MPQLLSLSGKTPVGFQLSNPSVAVFGHNPQLASFAFEALVSWTRIEAHQFELFVEIIGGPSSQNLSDYPQNATLRIKHDYVLPIAKDKLNEQELQIFSELLKRVESFSKNRNRLAHWSWGFADNFPDHLMLAKPAQFVLSDIDHAKVYTYSEADFISIIEENDCLAKRIRHFCGLLRSDSSEGNTTPLRLLLADLGL